jgi:hypothetical protein
MKLKLAIVLPDGTLRIVEDMDGEPIALEEYDLAKPIARNLIVAAIEVEMDCIEEAVEDGSLVLAETRAETKRLAAEGFYDEPNEPKNEEEA